VAKEVSGALSQDEPEQLSVLSRRLTLNNVELTRQIRGEGRDALVLQLAADLLGGRVNDPERVRYDFGVRFGRADPGPQSAVTVDLGAAAEGVVRVTYTIRSVTDWRKLPIVPTLPQYSTVEGIFRDAGKERARWRKPENVIRAVAVHYLTTGADQERSLRAAASLYDEALPPEDGTLWSPYWHERIVGVIEAEYGPLP
jgi:hypothetical protein